MVEELKPISIDWATIHNLQNFEASYDSKTDTLFIQTKENRPAVSVDCEGDFWVRVDPKTGEILGIEIEDFKKVFWKKYSKMFKSLKKQDNKYIQPVATIIQMEKCPA